MTMAGSEEHEEEGVYESDEEVKCIMHMPSYSSSSSEDVETEMTGPSRSSPVLLVPVKEEFQIYPDSVKSLIATTYPVILQRLQTFGSGIVGCVYLTLSFLLDWTIQDKKPTNVICDACIFSLTRPVTLLTFKSQTDRDKSLQYNAKLARHLITSVRKDLFSNFTVVSGVIDINECVTDETFLAQLNKLESEAKTCSVPQWLNMDKIKDRKLLDYFWKMVPTFDQDDVNQRSKQSDRQPFSGSSGLGLSLTSAQRIIGSLNRSSVSDKNLQRRDYELSRIAREMQGINAVLRDTAQKVKELSEEVHDMRTDAFSHHNRFVQSNTSSDVGVQTLVWADSDDWIDPDELLHQSAHDRLFHRRPSAPPPYEEAVRTQEILKVASKQKRRFSLQNQDFELQTRHTTPRDGNSQTLKGDHMRREDSSESLDKKEENLTDNQKFRRTKSDSAKSTPKAKSIGRRATSFCS